jgi:CRISPR-associated protein Cmr1
MIRVELCLETVTPLFLGGAAQQPELRPASVRGALRYWLRALVGSEYGSSLEDLHEKENSVFGSTEKSSSIVVRLLGELPRMHNFDLDRNAQGQQLRTGHNYFYYSTRLGQNERIPFFPADANLPTLVLQSRPSEPTNSDSFALAAGAAWLLTNLGGLGMRARRCAGSVQVRSIGSRANAVNLSEFTIGAQNATELLQHLQTGLNLVRALVGNANNPSVDYDTLHPQVCRVWVISGGIPWSTWKDAVDHLGSSMQSFRAGQGADRNRVNAIFGIPIMHGDDFGLVRRASPLWLRITRLGSGQYVGVASLFKSNFKEGQLEVGGGYRLIEDFVLNTLHGQEVVYT